MGNVEHYKKKSQRENLDRLLSLLKEHGKLLFNELKGELGVSSPTLSSYLKILGDKIIGIPDKKDRRKTWYMIRPKSREKVKAQLGKYEAIKFIERIDNPVYIDEKSEDGSRAMALFSSVPPTENREVWEKDLRKKIMFNMLLKVFPRLKKQCDMALVITVRGKGRNEP